MDVEHSLRARIDSSGVKTGAREMRDATQNATKDMQNAITKTDSVLKILAASFASAFSVAAITSFISSSIRAYARQEQALRQLETRIKTTGGAAGFSVSQFTDMAGALQKVTTFGADAILEMQALLGTFTEVRGNEFKRSQEIILDVSTALGTDLKSAALQVGKALDAPVEGVSALTRAGIQFTARQKEQIKTLVESGKVIEAQNLILDELSSKVGGAARAAAGGTGAFQQMQNSVGDAAAKLGAFITTADSTQTVILAIRDAADLLAGNTSIVTWASKSSDSMKKLAFAIKGIDLGFKKLGQEIGGLFAIGANITDFPAFLLRKFTGEGEKTSIDLIIESLKQDAAALEQEMVDFVAQLENINQITPPTPSEVINNNTPGSGAGPPRRRQGGSDDSAKKARDSLAAFVESLRAQVNQLTLSEDALLRMEAAQEIAGAGTTKLGMEAAALTEQIISLNAEERKREENMERVVALQRRAISLLEDTITPQEAFNNSIEEANKLLQHAIITYGEYERIVAKAQETLLDATNDEVLDRLREIENATKRFGDRFLDTMIDLTKGVQVSWRNMADAIVEDILRIILRLQVVDPLVKGLTASLSPTSGAGASADGGGISGIGSFLGSIAGSFFGPAKAGGGPVSPNRSYLVGERGPEVFSPDSAGNIIPNSALQAGGGNTIRVVNNFTIQGGGEVSPRSQSEIAAKVGGALQRSLSRVR